MRSTAQHIVQCFGLKGLRLMVRGPLPWGARPWALPGLTAWGPSAPANRQAKNRHKTTIVWTCQVVNGGSRWLRRPGVLVGDGALAWLPLAWPCVQHEVVLSSRVRRDAQVADFPIRPGRPRRGPKPRKGVRLPALRDRVAPAQRSGEAVERDWEGEEQHRVRLLRAVARWYRRGQPPLPLRWGLGVNAEGDPPPAAFFCPCLACNPRGIVTAFVLRWNIEGPGEESRRHWGLETQRQGAAPAIARTPPGLFGLFSLVCLMAPRLMATGTILAPRTTAGDAKTDATLAEVFAFVRRSLGTHQYFSPSADATDGILFPQATGETVREQLAATA